MEGRQEVRQAGGQIDTDRHFNREPEREGGGGECDTV